MDKDLESIQQVRDLVGRAKEVQKTLASLSQEELDRFCIALRDACVASSEALARMAVEETGFGVWQDKVLKNLLGSHTTWESVKNLKVVGVLSEDRIRGITEIGVPMGVVAALIPSTNPTSTVMYKTLIAIKSGNGIIISPHPNALRCILETVRIITEALDRSGAPRGILGCLSLVNSQSVDALRNANEGAGHTMVIHSRDEKIIREFAMKKAVFRLLVNTPGALGGVGATTNLAPALTLGCGAVGKSATSDNITPLNLVNIRRVAAGCRSLEEIRREGESLIGKGLGSPPRPAAAAPQGRPAAERLRKAEYAGTKPAGQPPWKDAESREPAVAPVAAAPAGVKAADMSQLSAEDVEAITELVMARLSQTGGA